MSALDLDYFFFVLIPFLELDFVLVAICAHCIRVLRKEGWGGEMGRAYDWVMESGRGGL